MQQLISWLLEDDNIYNYYVPDTQAKVQNVHLWQKCKLTTI